MFISHRNCDKHNALCCANMAQSENFDYWLDILDPQIAAAKPKPGLSPYQQAVLLAGII